MGLVTAYLDIVSAVEGVRRLLNTEGFYIYEGAPNLVRGRLPSVVVPNYRAACSTDTKF